jgi:hypothetical protein
LHCFCNPDWEYPNGNHYYSREEKEMKKDAFELALFYTVLIYFSYSFTKAFHMALDVITK